MPEAVNDIFLVAWTGGLESPQFAARHTDLEAHALAEQWHEDMNWGEGDRIDVLRINADGSIETLWTL